jgi:hypothetical protein
MANAALKAGVQQDAAKISAWLSSEAPGSYKLKFTSPIPNRTVMGSNFKTREGYTAVFILSPYPTPGGGDFTVITGFVE